MPTPCRCWLTACGDPIEVDRWMDALRTEQWPGWKWLDRGHLHRLDPRRAEIVFRMPFTPPSYLSLSQEWPTIVWAVVYENRTHQRAGAVVCQGGEVVFESHIEGEEFLRIDDAIRQRLRRAAMEAV